MSHGGGKTVGNYEQEQTMKTRKTGSCEDEEENEAGVEEGALGTWAMHIVGGAADGAGWGMHVHSTPYVDVVGSPRQAHSDVVAGVVIGQQAPGVPALCGGGVDHQGAPARRPSRSAASGTTTCCCCRVHCVAAPNFDFLQPTRTRFQFGHVVAVLSITVPVAHRPSPMATPTPPPPTHSPNDNV